MSKKPKIFKEPVFTKTPKSESLPNYKKMNPVWQIGILDIEGRWGYNVINEQISFSESEELINILVDKNLNNLSSTLDSLKKKKLTLSSFFSQLCSLGANDFPLEVIKHVSKDIKHHFFLSNLYPKLKEFEKLTWGEIENQTYGKEGKSKNHPIEKSKLIKEAQDRLKELNQDDVDELYSLRLEGQLRVFGIREFNCLKILWIDINHEICPSLKKHT